MAPKGPANLSLLEKAMASWETDLPDAVREMGRIYLEQIGALTQVIERLANELKNASKTDAELRRLCTVPASVRSQPARLPLSHRTCEHSIMAETSPRGWASFRSSAQPAARRALGRSARWDRPTSESF